MGKQKIIIAGAGVAGLTAARGLCKEFDVTVLEAGSRIGGRIHTVERAGMVVERGAEFVHGRLPVTMKMAELAELHLIPADGKMYRSENGRLTEESEMILHWDQLVQKMGEVEEDMTLQEFLDHYFGSPQYAEVRKQATRFAEGFDLADPALASVKALYREWSEEEGENFRVQEGYGALIAFLEKECRDAGCAIHTDDAVQFVETTGQQVLVETKSGRKYQSDKILITIPVPLLAAGSIKFVPAIDDYLSAAANIGSGKVVRIVLGFDKKFWPADTGFIFSEEKVPTWWTGLHGQAHTLTGWAGGSKAAALGGQDEEALINSALVSLAAILGEPLAALQDALVFGVATNWSDQEYSAGGYSYATPSTQSARSLLNTPVAEKIWFAGEGYAEGDHPGTVEAAMSHALQVADLIIQSR